MTMDLPSHGVRDHACSFPGDLLENCPGMLTELDIESGLTIQGWLSNCPPWNNHLDPGRPRELFGWCLCV